MLTPSVLRSLPEIPAPVLTVYLDTRAPKTAGREFTPTCLARFESGVKALALQVPPEEQALFRDQAERVRAHLENHPPRQRGLLILAGPRAWELIPLAVDTEDEFHWGAPSLAQLFWLLDEHRPCGIVLAERERARFFLRWLGELLELEERELRMEAGRRKEMGPVSRPGVRMSRGVDRDTFEHHRDAALARFAREIAERIGQWRAAEPIETVFLVGESETVRAIREELPQPLRSDAVLVEENWAWMTRAEIQERMEPVVAAREREREAALVGELLGSERGVALGVDETLAQLQQGRVRRIAVVKGFNGEVRECLSCGWVDRAAGAACPACGAGRRATTLREVFPGLARRHQAAVEVVSNEAAQKLREAGGIGGWLREFERKEYSAAAPARV